MSEAITHKIPVKHRLDKHVADVNVSSPADGQVLTYESATALWKNKPPTGAGENSWLHYRRAGAYHGPLLSGVYMNQALTSARMHSFPFYVPTTTTFDRIAIYVYTAVAGSECRLGIYGDNGSVYPGSLIVDAGYVSCGTTGLKELIINVGLSGLNWLTMLHSASGIYFSGIHYYYGWGLLGSSAWGTEVPRAMVYINQAYGALPNPYPSGGLMAGNVAYLISVRKA